MGGFPSLTRREGIWALVQAGFKLEREGGRHSLYGKPGFEIIAVPRHKGDIPRGTLKSIIDATGSTPEEFFALSKEKGKGKKKPKS